MSPDAGEPRRLRMLWVVSELEWRGGIGRVVAGATRALAERGHELHVAGPAREATPGPAGVTLHAWPERRPRVLHVPALLRLARALRPDLVHFHSALPHGELLLPLRGLRPRPRLFVTPHTARRADYPKRRARLGLRAADAVVAVSAWSAQRALAAGADAARAHVIHNGVEEVSPAPQAARERLVISLGNLSARKGVGTLVDAFARAAAGRPGWRLVIAGEGPEREALRARADRGECPDRIELAGYVAGAAKRSLLARASVGALPSQIDNFPGTLLELQAHGVASVATDAGGTRELAREGACLLAPPGDATALGEALGRLMDDAALRRKVVDAGLRLAAGLRWPDVAERYERLYRAYVVGSALPPADAGYRPRVSDG